MNSLLQKTILMLSALIGLTSNTFAHDGHDHNAPAKAKAHNKGLIKGNEKYFFEVVVKGNDIKIFTYANPQAVIKAADVKLSAKVELPRKKTEALSLSVAPSGDHYAASFDAKGAHRYTLLLSIDDGHGDVLKYTIEPKK